MPRSFDLTRPVTQAINAVKQTTTSAEIDARGYNSLRVETAISGPKEWTIKLQGSDVSGGPYIDLKSYQIYSSRCWTWSDIPNFVRIIAIEDEDGATMSVRVQPVNI